MSKSIWWHIGYGERKVEKAVAKLPVVAIVGVSYAGQYMKHAVHEMREGRVAASSETFMEQAAPDAATVVRGVVITNDVAAEPKARRKAARTAPAAA